MYKYNILMYVISFILLGVMFLTLCTNPISTCHKIGTCSKKIRIVKIFVSSFAKKKQKRNKNERVLTYIKYISTNPILVCMSPHWC